MYSPKIREDLIPLIYKLGKAERKPMTKVVDAILRNYLDQADLMGDRDNLTDHQKSKYKVREARVT